MATLPTATQVGLIEAAWGKVQAVGLQAAGELFFKTLFKAHPEGLQLFKAFASLPEYEQSEPFKAHALTVITALDKALSLLGDMDTEVMRLYEASLKLADHVATCHVVGVAVDPRDDIHDQR